MFLTVLYLYFFFWSFLYYDSNAIFIQPLARVLDFLALDYTFGLTPHYGLRKVYINNHHQVGLIRLIRQPD